VLARRPITGRNESAAAQEAGTDGAKEDLDKAFDWIDDFFATDEDLATCPA
jgi:hypothetical protein